MYTTAFLYSISIYLCYASACRSLRSVYLKHYERKENYYGCYTASIF